MKVTTNSKQIAMEVISAQNLINSTLVKEIKIQGIGSLKHGLNNYDAMVTIGNTELILFRDMNFRNVIIEDLVRVMCTNIEYIIEK